MLSLQHGSKNDSDCYFKQNHANKPIHHKVVLSQPSHKTGRHKRAEHDDYDEVFQGSTLSVHTSRPTDGAVDNRSPTSSVSDFHHASASDLANFNQERLHLYARIDSLRRKRRDVEAKLKIVLDENEELKDQTTRLKITLMATQDQLYKQQQYTKKLEEHLALADSENLNLVHEQKKLLQTTDRLANEHLNVQQRMRALEKKYETLKMHTRASGSRRDQLVSGDSFTNQRFKNNNSDNDNNSLYETLEQATSLRHNSNTVDKPADMGFRQNLNRERDDFSGYQSHDSYSSFNRRNVPNRSYKQQVQATLSSNYIAPIYQNQGQQGHSRVHSNQPQQDQNYVMTSARFHTIGSTMPSHYTSEDNLYLQLQP